MHICLCIYTHFYGKRTPDFVIPCYLVLLSGSFSKWSCLKRLYRCTILKKICYLNKNKSVEGLYYMDDFALHQELKLYKNVEGLYGGNSCLTGIVFCSYSSMEKVFIAHLIHFHYDRLSHLTSWEEQVMKLWLWSYEVMKLWNNGWTNYEADTFLGNVYPVGLRNFYQYLLKH